MKQNLSLLAVIFAVLNLCKAGPLRLHKRAAFYIANETACVVDNIVYSSGDPIPTDDPCEACKCRPPGFACVLKECRAKPGCRAVRHAGQCCPDYVCGCEHNGRMYEDGEEIRNPENPCYTCHCQGSSIACAFVDCFFRVDCIPEYVQGECCPKYNNCTRDLPDNNSFEENNNVPSLNLLPALNDDSILPVKIPEPQAPVPSEIPADPPTRPPVFDDRDDEVTAAPEVKESTTQPNVPQTTESESSGSEESKLDAVVEDKGKEEKTASNESTSDQLSDGVSEDIKVEKSEEKVVFNSESEIGKGESVEITTAKIEDPVETSEEVVKVDGPQTTEPNKEKLVNEAEAPEKNPETEYISTEVSSGEKEVKNSAADNSKSLKLSDDESDTQELSNLSEKEKEIKTEEPEKTASKSVEIVTQPSTESTKVESVNPSDNKPEFEEKIADESQNNPHVVVYNNDDKIKSESAETVTIVVHVKEKTKLTTETDFVSEKVTTESGTSTTQENLLKSSDELKSTEISTKPAEVEKTASTSANFEVFPSSTEANDKEISTSSPSTDEISKVEAESRSEGAEISASDPKGNPVTNESTTDSKIEEKYPVVTTQSVKDVTEPTPTEARADEDITEEAKTEDPKVTVIETEEPNASTKIQITTESDTGVSKNEGPNENVEATEEIKSEKSVDEIKPEIREEVDSKPEEKELTTSSAIDIRDTSPVTEQIKTEERTAETELVDKDTANVESTKPEESKENQPAVTTESRNQATEESTQTEAPNKDKE